MSKTFALALLASASILSATADPASAQSAPPVRMASNMGGGFIEFLFGDAPRGGRYEPMYQQQPDVGYDGRRLPPMDPQGVYRQQEAVDPVLVARQVALLDLDPWRLEQGVRQPLEEVLALHLASVGGMLLEPQARRPQCFEESLPVGTEPFPRHPFERAASPEAERIRQARGAGS